MKKIILAILCIICIFGCGVNRPVIEYRDSVRVEYRDRIMRDTVEYELPVIIEKHIVDDTLSVIENDYAKTTAVVHDGLLSHNLQTKPKILRIPVEVQVRDTVIVEKKAEIREVEVEKKLTWWQKIWMKLGKIFIGFILVFVIYVFIKKGLLSL